MLGDEIKNFTNNQFKINKTGKNTEPVARKTAIQKVNNNGKTLPFNNSKILSTKTVTIIKKATEK